MEAKWLYNYIINKELNSDIFNMDYKVNKVPVYVKDHYEIRDLKYLSSQMREEIIIRTNDNKKKINFFDRESKRSKIQIEKEILEILNSREKMPITKTSFSYYHPLLPKQRSTVIG